MRMMTIHPGRRPAIPEPERPRPRHLLDGWTASLFMHCCKWRAAGMRSAGAQTGGRPLRRGGARPARARASALMTVGKLRSFESRHPVTGSRSPIGRASRWTNPFDLAVRSAAIALTSRARAGGNISWQESTCETVDTEPLESGDDGRRDILFDG